MLWTFPLNFYALQSIMFPRRRTSFRSSMPIGIIPIIIAVTT
jgi:hypothetical protein